MKKKVLIINTSGLGVGGITTNMINYIQALNSLYDFSIIQTIIADENIICKFRNLNCQIFNLPNRKRNIFSYCIALYKIMQKNNYDVVHIHGNSSLMVIELVIAFVAGIKNRIVHCHNSQCDHPIINKLLRPILLCLKTEAAACSKVSGDWLYGNNNYEIIRNAFSCEEFSYCEEIRDIQRNNYNIKKDQIVLGVIGSLNQQKNPFFSIEILKKIVKDDKFQLFYIGDGILKNDLERLIEKYNLSNNVRLLGLCDDIKNKLQMIDIYLFPSLFEGLGITILEAQASGCLCLASKYVPIETKYSNMTKYLDLDYDVWITQIYKSINKLSNYNRKAMSEEIINDMKIDYEITTNAEKLLNIYEHIKE